MGAFLGSQNKWKDFWLSQRYRGVILVLIATFLFSIHDTSSKFLTAHYAAAQIVWMRYLCQFTLVLLIAAPGRWCEITMTRRPLLTILRGTLQGCSSLFVVTALSTLPLAETTSMVFISPLLVALFAGPILGEKVSRRQWLLIVTGFCGVLLIARPGGAVFGVGMLYALACAVCYALYQVLTRKLTATEPPLRLLFYNGLLGTLVTSLLVPSCWSNVVPTLPQASIILSLGVYGCIGHFMIIRAFSETPASILSPLLYSQLVWSTLLGWQIFGHFPDLLTLLGMLIIGGSSLSLALKQAGTGQRAR